MPYNKIRFGEELKNTLKIIKEAKKDSYNLIFFNFNNTNYLFGYSFNEKASPFLLKESDNEFIINTKHIFTTNSYKIETNGSLISKNFNFNMTIKDFVKIYLNGELEIKEKKKQKNNKSKIKKT